MDKNKQVANILSLLLKQEISISDDVSMQNCEAWDSMKHIEIITTIEDELDVSFDVIDIPRLTSMKLIVEKVEELI